MGALEPPATQVGSTNSNSVTCPWCGSGEVERLGAFGAQLMGEPYFCKRCHSPFERIRKRGETWEKSRKR